MYDPRALKLIGKASVYGVRRLSLRGAGLPFLPPEVKDLERLQELDFSGNRLLELPTALFSAVLLTTLDLSSNQLVDLPREIGRLIHLVQLDLAGNQLAALPPDVGHLEELTTLDLSGNRLVFLPRELARLSRLEVLRLGGNRLEQLPEEVSSLGALTTLDLSGNRLTCLEPQILRLQGLTSLRLRDNGIAELPGEISQLTGLQELDLSGNRLAELPSEISKLTRLQELRLQGNRLTACPEGLARLESLEVLDLAGNGLASLPAQLGRLTRLKDLRLAGNPLRDPPPEVVHQGTEAVLAYLRDSLERTVDQWVSKLLIVGEGGVGKTCLLRALQGEGFDPASETTHGIEIQTLRLPHPRHKNVAMTLNCWDFGGQQIYHATHQFFLTNRSLFLLVWNARIGFEQSKLYGWLDRIRALAPESPILIVATHTDERDADLPWEDLQRRYLNVRGHHTVSSKDGRGIRQLQEAIRDAAARLPLMGERWPTTWLSAAQAVRSRAENYISLGELRRLMREHQVEGESQEVLARWLHDLGDLLFFPDDQELSSVIILNPEWVSRHISKILECEEIIEGLGVFRHDHMIRIWSSLDRGLWDVFLRLMERFDLSYRIPDDTANRSLVVERLSLDPPDYHARWEEILRIEGCCEIVMKLDLQCTCPPGIPTWFIARAHRFTTHTHWRHGALFADSPSGGHLALVVAPPAERYVTLAVRGPAPYSFFALLKDGLELTLARFPGLRLKRTIPCPGRDGGPACGHEFDHEHLTRRISRVPPKHWIECPSCEAEISIPKLLFGIHWSTRDAVLERIDLLEQANLKRERKILEQQKMIQVELQGLRELTQREFTQQFSREQRLSESHSPCVFSLRPHAQSAWLSLSKLAGQTWELHLYCEAPGHWHPTERGGRYKIDEPARWIEVLSPYLRRLIKILKFAAPLMGPGLGYTGLAHDEEVKRDAALMKALVDKLPDESLAKSGRERLGSDDEGEAARIGGAPLRGLRKLLDELDPQQHWGGLRKVLTPEGHYLWLCEQHVRELKL